MIPYQLKIHGVRDYGARSIYFGEPDEHILITGPNGVGKSTLTFCLGAVLYSSKVEVEGLRSTNLKVNEPWNARITLVFLNEGPTKVDGPKFIAFQLTVQQDAKNGPIQREFEVLNGASEDDLTSQACYTSGGSAGRTFSAYREDLQVRYKIEPDLYYLIWYQQEVNQFAAMYPEERFHKFSDMFHISETQREWEALLAKIKDAEVEIGHLKGIQKGSELNVNAAKNELKKYLDNKNRILISGQKYYTLLHQLIDKYSTQIETTAQQKVQDQIEKEKKQLERHQIIGQKEQLETQTKEVSSEQQCLEQQLEQLNTKLLAKNEEEKKRTNEQKQLEHLLEGIDEKRNRLRFDAVTTEQKLQETTLQVTSLTTQQQGLSEQQATLRDDERALEKEKLCLEMDATRLSEALVESEKYKVLYVSSAHIEQQIRKMEQQNEQVFERIQHGTMEAKRIEENMKQYKLKKVVSKRQQQGLAHLRQQNCEAYPLRELIELIPSAPLQLEKQLEAIKYTIFYVGKQYKPVNDLYYVSLTELVPTESVSKLPELGLQIRSDLNEQMANYANKVLWWVKQFFVANPIIEHNILVDERGLRGAQEEAQYILSDVAIEKLLQEQQEHYTKTTNELQQLEQFYVENQRQHNELFGHLRTIQTAESTLLRRTKHTELIQQFQLTEQKLDALYDTQNALEIRIDKLKSEFSDAKHASKFLHEQWEIHEELGAYAEQQIQLQTIQQACKNLQQQIRELQRQQGAQENQLNDVKRNASRLNEKIQGLASQLTIVESQHTGIDLSIKQAIERMEADEAAKSSFELNLLELENVLPQEAKQLDETLTADQSLMKLMNDSEQAKAALQIARLEEVNENAQQNYDQLKADYDKKNTDLAESELLLESNTIRANELEDRLETTINMYLTKINALFQKYMDLFQFEGQIEKGRIEDKSGRVKFQLYIKARKIGHQGALEEVSMKARSGKVGKGVSGGEESLSSLLFALALLQNLSISPGYIVLDEFDSALDDERKNKVFNLYAEELQRKLIIVSPKGHDEAYYNCFSKVFIVEHDATIPRSTVRGIQNRK